MDNNKPVYLDTITDYIHTYYLYQAHLSNQNQFTVQNVRWLTTDELSFSLAWHKGKLQYWWKNDLPCKGKTLGSKEVP